jgi:hypothetical protein
VRFSSHWKIGKSGGKRGIKLSQDLDRKQYLAWCVRVEIKGK